MSQLTITLTITLPDGASVAVGAPPSLRAQLDAASPPATAASPAMPGLCPIHGTPWTHKPGGTTKDGRPYGAFWACSKRAADGSYCREKPPKGYQPPESDEVPF